MTETAEEHTHNDDASPGGACLCAFYARATEAAALASARWLGRADREGAEEAAFSAMARALSELPIDGNIVIGATDEGQLSAGERIGAGGVPVHPALDPLEGRGVVPRGGSGAMSMLAVGEPRSLMTLPEMYMRRMAVGPRAEGSIDLGTPA